jgi:hypothetical protein
VNQSARCLPTKTPAAILLFAKQTLGEMKMLWWHNTGGHCMARRQFLKHREPTVQQFVGVRSTGINMRQIQLENAIVLQSQLSPSTLSLGISRRCRAPDMVLGAHHRVLSRPVGILPLGALIVGETERRTGMSYIMLVTLESAETNLLRTSTSVPRTTCAGMRGPFQGQRSRS